MLCNPSLLLPTFVNQSFPHQLGKLQIVEGKNVVEDNGPEVGSVEHTPDPAWHGFTHCTLETVSTEVKKSISFKQEWKNFQNYSNCLLGAQILAECC